MPEAKIFQHVVNRNAHSTNAGFAASLAQLNCDHVLTTDVLLLRECLSRQDAFVIVPIN